jgi:molybdopterin converting factor small subunit
MPAPASADWGWASPLCQDISNPMAHVTLVGNLRQFTGGVTEIEVAAQNVHQLFRRLGEKYPSLLPHLQTGSAVAIDGQIYQDALFQEIGPDSDVHILPQIAGG